jgi:hypothetical protein
MTRLTWDGSGERLYETGVDHGVLYIPTAGVYDTGVAWNGLVSVTESPSGAEATPLYADNIKYLNLMSKEEFGATIEAFTYPDEFAQCDGSAEPQVGVRIGQQPRKIFGLSYRTQLGDDLEGTELGYKLHLVYGCQASPSEKAYGTVNDTPEAITFSWELTTTEVAVTNYKPTAIITIDSTKVDPADLATLEDLLYGTAGTGAQLPTPDAVLNVFGTGVTTVDMGVSTNQPTYVAGTHVVTLPSVTGVTWYINGVVKTPGAQPALTTGQSAEIHAVPSSGSYVLTGDTDWIFDY